MTDRRPVLGELTACRGDAESAVEQHQKRDDQHPEGDPNDPRVTIEARQDWQGQPKEGTPGRDSDHAFGVPGQIDY